MEVLKDWPTLSEKLKGSKNLIILIVIAFVIIIAIGQDLIYSFVNDTGFYISESLLYNSIWIIFIPLTFCLLYIIGRVNARSTLKRLPINILLAVATSFLHIFVFSCLFVLVSYFVFNPVHSFSRIFSSALSNQFYIAVIWYSIFPFAFHFFKRSKSNQIPRNPLEQVKSKIIVKSGKDTILLDIDEILYVSTDKPYTVIHARVKSYLDNRSLKNHEDELDSKLFRRVHRSTLVNITKIQSMTSRSNGDFDATLSNGELIRMSRHYRENWDDIIH